MTLESLRFSWVYVELKINVTLENLCFSWVKVPMENLCDVGKFAFFMG